MEFKFWWKETKNKQGSNLIENKYIKAIYLNGKPYKKLYISHKDIMAGGELMFEMSNIPNDVGLGSYELPEVNKVY